MPKYQDLLVCWVSTQLKQYIPNFDEIISPNDTDFELSGLTSPSVIRLSFLTVIPNINVIGAIGNISMERYQSLIANLAHYLTQNEYSL
jgi:mRNA interferase MazF